MNNNLSNIVRHLILVMAICLSGTAYAASGSAKQINDIKRSGTCFHAESTAATKQEATQAATQMLAYYINDYIKDNGLSHPRVTENSIPGIQYLEMKRGANIRVFAYVDRNVILNGETPNPQPQYEEMPETPSTPPAPAPSAPAPQPAPAAPAPEVYEEPNTQLSSQEPDCLDESGAGDENLTVSESDAVAQSPVMRTYVEALESLVAAGDLQSVLAKLNRLQAEYIVKRYGPYAKCANKTWAFWMIYDSTGKNLEGFLSPGNEGERLNIVTNAENDRLSNYMNGQGKVAVWFEFR